MVDESVVFDRAAGYYDDTRGFPPGEDRNVAAFMAQAAGLMGDERVLEIGVGTGRIAIPLSAHSGRYTGLDLSALMMQRLREKESSDGRVHLTQGDALRLPLAPESFDVAVIVHVLHLVPDRAQVIAELARVLRPVRVGGFCRHAIRGAAISLNPCGRHGKPRHKINARCNHAGSRRTMHSPITAGQQQVRNIPMPIPAPSRPTKWRIAIASGCGPKCGTWTMRCGRQASRRWKRPSKRIIPIRTRRYRSRIASCCGFLHARFST